MSNKYCVIMAGGIGSRFWPLSQKDKPKQFIDILSTGKSMIRETYDRFLSIVPKENIIILTNEIYRSLVLEYLPDIKESHVLCEPLKRNTAPCIAYAAHWIYSQNKNGVMVVAPSDHYIGNKGKFDSDINECFDIVESNDILMTIGVRPYRPETGYGYIQMGDKYTDAVSKVKTFTEKPDLEMAKVFLDSGEFLWNSGIFLWSCKSIISAFELYAPHINSIFIAGDNLYNTSKEQAFINEFYSECENISIDYAIMEKAKNVHVYDANFVWSDIGTWGSLYDHLEKDEHNNAVNTCDAIFHNASNCLVATDSNKSVVIDGLNDYIIVDSESGLLICPMANEHKIRKYINEIK